MNLLKSISISELQECVILKVPNVQTFELFMKVMSTVKIKVSTIYET